MRAGWFVIQVQVGRERQACEAMGRVFNAETNGDLRTPLLRECFSPRFRTQFKLHGEWHDEERLLLPGYVVAVTADPWGLSQVLRGVSGPVRVLRTGETYAPLGEDDREWLERWTSEGDRAIPMSVARKVGDRVVVTEGPLKGREATIARIDRRRSTAELEMRVGQRTVRATVGLAVLP